MSANADQKFADALQAMLDEMAKSLPAFVPGLPHPSVSAVTVTQRTLGLGNFRAEDTRGGFTPAVLMGGRIDALLRFQLWDAGPGEVESATQALTAGLLGRRDDLFTKGFLRFNLKSIAPSESIAEPSAWRQNSEFQVLYEYQFADSDADSLIARIPIRLQEQFDESTEVTDEMTRWDKDAALALAVRGPSAVGGLSALDFIPAAPTGTVTVLRTFDGAAGPPAVHLTWPDFLSAATGPGPSERHSQIVFASLTSFLAVFVAEGDPVVLGTDSYKERKAGIDPAILLPDAADRFQITFQNAAFDKPAILYLRATRGAQV